MREEPSRRPCGPLLRGGWFRGDPWVGCSLGVSTQGSRNDGRESCLAMGLLSETTGEPASLLCRRVSEVPGIEILDSIEQIELGRPFANEQLYRAPARRWLNRDWEQRLAAVNDVIYKIALESRAST